MRSSKLTTPVRAATIVGVSLGVVVLIPGIHARQRAQGEVEIVPVRPYFYRSACHIPRVGV